MISRALKAQDNSHLGDLPAALFLRSPSCSRHSADTIQNRCRTAPQFAASGTTELRFAGDSPVQSTSVHIWVSRGVLSWVEYLRPPRERRPKPAVRIVGIPTHLSVMHWPTSRGMFFGVKIQRLVWRLRAAAACGWRNAISAVTAIGRALQSLPSFPKFSVDTRCGTSRSFPNGDRRPF